MGKGDGPLGTVSVRGTVTFIGRQGGYTYCVLLLYYVWLAFPLNKLYFTKFSVCSSVCKSIVILIQHC